jgi:hypothetical protein
MSTSPNGADIIIKGGSVEIQFNEQTLSVKGGQYRNKDRMIAAATQEPRSGRQGVSRAERSSSATQQHNC